MKPVFEKLVCFVVYFQFLTCYTSFAGVPVSACLGIDQGLSNNFVRCVYQDKNGFMWFGTYDGLNRYDGYEFKIFRNNFKNNAIQISLSGPSESGSIESLGSVIISSNKTVRDNQEIKQTFGLS